MKLTTQPEIDSAVERTTQSEIDSAERTLRRGTWGITAGAVLYSVLTVTPLVARVTPEGWEATSPILPLVVDAAVIVSVKLDATVARLGEKSGGWATLLRWMTGLMTLGLNVGDSALKGDRVGVAVHAVIPLILIVITDAGLSWRRSINRALERIAREQREEQERSRLAQQAAREQQRADREQEQQRREQADRDAREHAEQLERERLDREAEQRREEREHALTLEERRAQREAEQRREEREERDRERAIAEQQRERERREQQQRDLRAAAEQTAALADRKRANRETREQASTPSVNTPAVPVNTTTTPVNKLSESEALDLVQAEVNTRTVRELAEATGWSVGWISARVKDIRQPVMAEAGAR